MIETLLYGLMQANITKSIIEDGETDGVNAVKYLDNLKDVININGCTDILSAVVGEDNLLSLLISNADDTKQEFCSLHELPLSVIKQIFDQIVKYNN